MVSEVFHHGWLVLLLIDLWKGKGVMELDSSPHAAQDRERQLERPGTRHDPQVVATVTRFLQLGPTS